MGLRENNTCREKSHCGEKKYAMKWLCILRKYILLQIPTWCNVWTRRVRVKSQQFLKLIHWLVFQQKVYLFIYLFCLEYLGAGLSRALVGACLLWGCYLEAYWNWHLSLCSYLLYCCLRLWCRAQWHCLMWNRNALVTCLDCSMRHILELILPAWQ